MIATIGAKEGLSHLMWVLLQPGDVAVVPEPSYPIHIYAPVLAGAEVRRAPVASDDLYFDSLERMFKDAWPRPRVIILSFPHNPTTVCVDLAFFERLVAFAREREVFLVHDFAYADVAFDGYVPPPSSRSPGAKDVAVELYTLTKGHSMAGWRMGFSVGNACDGRRPRQAQELSRLRDLPADPDRLDHRPQRRRWLRRRGHRDVYQRRRDVLIDGLNRNGWKVERPSGTMFVWAPIPDPYVEQGSMEFTMAFSTGPRWPSAPELVSGPAATPMFGLPWWRTSTESRRP